MVVPFAQIGYIAAFAGYMTLAVIYIMWGRWGWPGRAFLLATILTAAWAGVALEAPWRASVPFVTDLLHHAASLAWILFLWLLIALSAEMQKNHPRRMRLGWTLIGGMTVVVIGFDVFH